MAVPSEVLQSLKQMIQDYHHAVEVLAPSDLNAQEWGLFADREDRSLLTRIFGKIADPADLTFALKDVRKVSAQSKSLALVYVFLSREEHALFSKWSENQKKANLTEGLLLVRFFTYQISHREHGMTLQLDEIGRAQMIKDSVILGAFECKTADSPKKEELNDSEKEDLEVIGQELRKILNSAESTPS